MKHGIVCSSHPDVKAEAGVSLENVHFAHRALTRLFPSNGSRSSSSSSSSGSIQTNDLAALGPDSGQHLTAKCGIPQKLKIEGAEGKY